MKSAIKFLQLTGMLVALGFAVGAVAFGAWLPFKLANAILGW